MNTIQSAQEQAQQEQAQQEQEQTKADPGATMATISADSEYQTARRDIETAARCLRESDTATRTDIANRIRETTESLLLRFWSDRSQWPKARAGLYDRFATDIGPALGLATTGKDLYKWIRTAATRDLLPADAKEAWDALNWSVMMTCGEWTRFNTRENTHEIAIAIFMGTDRARFIDATDQLSKLVKAFSSIGCSVKDVRETLAQRAREMESGAKELLDASARKQILAALATRESMQKAKDRQNFFAGIGRKVGQLGLSADDVFKGLDAVGLTANRAWNLETVASELSEQQAVALVALLNSGERYEILGAIVQAVASLQAATDAAKQPNKSATATIDALGATRAILKKTG
jgi:hypothetical protein